MKHALAQALSWIGRHELSLLVALLIAAGCAWTFAEIADEVVEGETQAIDERLLLALREPEDVNDPIGPEWAEELARDVTALGSVGVLTFVTLAGAGFLLLQRRRGLALYLIASVAGATVLSSLLKSGFERARPDLVAHEQVITTASFPSGHAMLSAVTFLTVGALLASAQSGVGMRAYVLSLATLLCVAVGASRVYLGVHWATDVLAGWTLGAAWALACWAVAAYLHRRGRV
jgi:undecaprenyl-diphosphatase